MRVGIMEEVRLPISRSPSGYRKRNVPAKLPKVDVPRKQECASHVYGKRQWWLEDGWKILLAQSYIVSRAKWVENRTRFQTLQDLRGHEAAQVRAW